VASELVSYPQTSAEHRVKVPNFSFACASVRQLHPSGQTGAVSCCFMQYFGTWITAASVAVLCSYPQTSLEHRVHVPPFALAVSSLMQLQPSGQTGVVVPCFTQYSGVWYWS
jgi:hypothetical protein